MTESKNSYSISYFPFNGRGAAPRHALFLAKQEYVEDFIGWGEFVAKRTAGGAQWKGLPELTVKSGDGSSTHGQSNAILRYIGRQFPASGLYPSDPLQGLIVDEFMDAVEDMVVLLSPSMQEKDEAKKKKMREDLAEGDLLYYLKKMDARFVANQQKHNSKYAVGSSLTIADLKIFWGLNALASGSIDFIPPSILDKVPAVKAHTAFIKELPETAAFIKKFSDSQAAYKKAQEAAAAQK